MRRTQLLRLGWRLSRGSDRRGLIRLLLVCVGLAVAVACVLLASSYPFINESRNEKMAARIARTATDTRRPSFAYQPMDDTIHDRRWMRVLVRGAAGAPLPPGIPHYPRPGETYASPALVRQAQRSPEVRARLGRVVGEITPAGLQGPEEYVSYTGLTAKQAVSASRGVSFGISVAQVPNKQSSRALAAELLLLVAPAAVAFLMAATRLSIATRMNRTAVLRLVGMSRHHLLGLARTEGAWVGALGAMVGTILFQLVYPALGRSSVLGIGWYSHRSAVSWLLLVPVMFLVSWVVSRVAGAGMGRALDNPTAAVRGGDPRPRRTVWRLIPFLAGLGVLVGMLIFSWGSPTTSSPHAVLTVAAAGTVTIVGALTLVTPIAHGTGDVVGGRSRHLALRLAARRVQFESSSLVRVTSGLMALVMAVVLAQAAVRAATLAAGIDSNTQQVQVTLDSHVPAADRHRLDKVPAQARVTSLLPTMQGALPGDVVVVVADCASVRHVTSSSLPACQDHQAYRLEDADPQRPRNRIPAGGRLSVQDAMGHRLTTLVAPRQSLTVSGLWGNIGADTLLLTEPAGPSWMGSASGTMRLWVGTGQKALDRLQAAVGQAAPGASTTTNRDIAAIDTVRLHRSALTLGLVISLLLTLGTFVIASVDRAMERRRAVASLVVVGTPAGLLRRSQVVQILLVLVPSLIAGLAVSTLVGHDYLVLADPKNGPSWIPFKSGALTALLAVLIASFGALPLPGLHPRPEDLQGE